MDDFSARPDASPPSLSLPKKQLAIFVAVNTMLVVAVIVAVLRHVRVLYAMLAFIVLSVINGIVLIITVVKQTAQRS